MVNDRVSSPALALTLAFVVAVFRGPSVAASEMSELEAMASSVVKVSAYSGRELATTFSGFVVNRDQYSGYVVTRPLDAEGFTTVTVTHPANGVELVARNLVDRSSDIALLKVDGLDLPALRFARAAVVAGDTVWSGAVTGRNSDVALTRGSVSRTYVVPSAAQLIKMMVHNAGIGSSGAGSPVVNACGQVLGLNLSVGDESLGITYGMTSGSLGVMLKKYNVPVVQETEDCLTEAGQARVQADRAAQEAKEAKRDAETALANARSLQLQLEVAEREKRELIGQTRQAQARADQAISEASKANSAVAAARADLEERTSRILDETRRYLRTIEDEHQSKEAQMRQEFDERNRSMERQMTLMGVGFFVLFAVTFGAMVYLRGRPFDGRPRASRAPRDDGQSSDTVLQTPLLKEYVLDGEDEKGIRYMLRISGEQLVRPDGVVIGRSPGGTPAYVINHEDVSRKHARLKLMQNRLFLEDLDSTNGTTVNGQPIDDKGLVAINLGDQIMLGTVVMKVRAISGAA